MNNNLKALLVLLLALAGAGLSLQSGKRESDLLGPKGMALDGRGQLYLYSDEHLHRLAPSYEQIPVSEFGFSNHLMDFLFLPNGRILVSESPGLKLFSCDIQSRQCKLFAESERWLFVHLAFDPYTGHIATAGNIEPTLRLYDLTGALLAEKGYSQIETINDLAFDRSGQLAVAFSGKNSVLLLDASQSKFGEQRDALSYLPDVLNIKPGTVPDPAALMKMLTSPSHPMSVMLAKDGAWWVALSDGFDQAARLVIHDPTTNKIVHNRDYLNDAGMGNLLQLPNGEVLASDPYRFRLRRLSELGSWMGDYGPPEFADSLKSLNRTKKFYHYAWYAGWLWAVAMLLVLLRINDKSQKPAPARPIVGRTQREAKPPSQPTPPDNTRLVGSAAPAANTSRWGWLPFGKKSEQQTETAARADDESELGVGCYAVQHKGGDIYMILSSTLSHSPST